MLSLPFIPCDLGPSITLLGPVAHRIRPEEKALGEPDDLEEAAMSAANRTGAGFEALDSRRNASHGALSVAPRKRGRTVRHRGSTKGTTAKYTPTTKGKLPAFAGSTPAASIWSA